MKELSRDEDELLDAALRFAMRNAGLFSEVMKIMRYETGSPQLLEQRLRDLHDKMRKAHKIIIHFE